jgi:hypothetical protein
MQFTLKRLLLWFVPLGLALAVLQRPLRTPEFVNGLHLSVYPWLWLCYCEGNFSTKPSGGECAGMLLGVCCQVVAIIIGLELVAKIRRRFWPTDTSASESDS